MGSSPFPSYASVVVSIFSLSIFAFCYAEEDFSSHCASFNCGKLINFSYPFSNRSECGLSIIDCVHEKPTIRLGKRPYEVIVISGRQKTTLIRDQEFTKSLRDNNCNDLYNFTTLDSPSLFFKLTTPNLTFFICKRHPRTSHQEIFSGFQRYQGCRDHDLYFSDFNFMHSLALVPAPAPATEPAPAPAPEPQGFPHDCRLIQFPVQELPPFNGNWSLDALVSLFATGFFLEWTLPQECNKCKSRTRCLRHFSGNFICEDRKNHRGKKPEVNLLAGISGVVAIIIALLLFIIYRCHKQTIRETKGKNQSLPSTLPFEDISSFSSSKTNLEKGSSYFGVPIFTNEELKEATDNFNPSKELGDGGFGMVYLGKLRDGRVVAVKRLYENNFKRLEQFMNEVEILTRLRHQNLVTLYGCTSRRSRELLLVYEFIPNGTVADHLHGNRAKAGSVTWPVRMNIAIETADALTYLHASDVIHRDVKTNNILLDNNFRVKVADFGLSRLFPTDATYVSTAPQGTPGYVDPEYYQSYQITDKSDVYSFGVVLIELISSKQAVDVNRHRHEINLANMAISKIHNHSLHELIDPCLGFESDNTVWRMTSLVAELAFRCLQQEREMRPSMDEVLEVLRGIEMEDYKVDKAEVVDSPADDVGLLKSIPVSMSDKWASSSTTPNISF